MLGVERYNDAPSCLCSVRSESDVVVYAFPQDDFDAFVMKYPSAAQYVAAEGRVTADYHPAGGRRAPQSTFLHSLIGHEDALDVQRADQHRRCGATDALDRDPMRSPSWTRSIEPAVSSPSTRCSDGSQMAAAMSTSPSNAS